jgi:dTDP-4-dehydrorhamnose reductase
MKKIQIILVGKRSFIASYINKYLKNKIFIHHVSLEKFLNMKTESIKKFNFLCNCTVNKKYQSNKYSLKNDFDLKIIKKIIKINIKYIFLSSRKVYKNGENLHENSKKQPIENYEKNKLITEKFIRQTIPKRFIILRVSNIIAPPIKNKRKVTINFIDNFFDYISSDKIIKYNNYFKDFLSIEQFVFIFFQILKKDIIGTYNVSLGKKVYIKELLKWLTRNKDHNFEPIKKFKNNDSFYLNNNKLTKKLDISILKRNLKNYCLRIKV